MDKKHLTFLVVFFAILSIAITTLFALTIDNNNISGQAIQQDLIQGGVKELPQIQEYELTGINSVDDLFNVFDRDNDGSLSYQEFKMVSEIMLK